MTRDEYLEDEWPKEEPEAAPEEDLCESDDDIWPEEPESTAYRPPDEYRLFQMEDPPEFSGGLSAIQKAEACYQQYCRTKQLRYFLGFLHYYEPTLNFFANDFMLRYAMGGHFADLKQAALFGIFKAKKKYEHDRKTLFYRYADHYIHYNIAALYYDLRDIKKAIPHSEKALGVFQRILGENHPYSVTAKDFNELLRKTLYISGIIGEDYRGSLAAEETDTGIIMNTKAIVLTIEKDTRVLSEANKLPSVLRLFCGKPLLHYVLKALDFIPTEDIPSTVSPCCPA